MRRFITHEPRPEYDEPHAGGYGRADAEICTTEAYIYRYYWPYYSEMIEVARRHGRLVPPPAFEDCIENWMVVHWAKEVAK